MKSLDTKLERIHADPSCGEFILADAKDADMAYGIAAPGQDWDQAQRDGGRYRTLAEYRGQIRQNVEQGLVDIMLMSVSTCEAMALDEGIFDDSHVTPAIRANDTTEIHLAKGGVYPTRASRPFRTALLDHAMAGAVDPSDDERTRGADLGLYSVTFNNDLDRDLDTLEAYRAFRVEAERKGFRHFLEVFDPNDCGGACPADLGRYINDMIVRTLAGVARAGRPVFLKMVYHGPEAMEQLAAYDPHLVPGILGGSAGTTYDAFHMLHEAKKHGAKVALYGRKINNAEDQRAFISHLRNIADGNETPKDAVRAYHADLERIKVTPHRPLEDDMKVTETTSSYNESADAKAKRRSTGVVSSVIPSPATPHPPKPVGAADAAGGEPDFSKMSVKEKLRYNLEANRFWEAMGFMPIAFRTGSRGRKGSRKAGVDFRGRIHIFWQKRIRLGDEQTPWWFPSKTNSGAVMEDRIVLPIPPGTSWRDAKPAVLPEEGTEGGSDEVTKSIGSKGKKKRANKKREKVVKAPVVGVPQAGLRFKPPTGATKGEGAVGEKVPKAKRVKQKADPKLVAFARELRDRWQEAVEREPGMVGLGCEGKYDMGRWLEDGGTGARVPRELEAEGMKMLDVWDAEVINVEEEESTEEVAQRRWLEAA